MSFRKLAMAAVLSVALSSAPVMAQQTQSVSDAGLARASADLQETSEQAQFPFVIVGLVLAAVVAGVIALTDSNNSPTSP